MALLWQKEVTGICYQVRSAGNSLRLYTNGAFHSQHNRKQLFTGAIWDMLSLPALFQPLGLSRLSLHPRVLVLGVGGGTVIHQLHALISPRHITGVEIDPVHLHIAVKFFKLNYPELDLVQADAINFVSQHRRRYDLIVDDVFLHADQGEPARPAPMNLNWIRKCQRRLGPTGMLVQNHLTSRGARLFFRSHADHIMNSFQSVLLFENEGFENGVLAYYPQNALTRREALGRIEPSARRKLRFRVTRLA